MVTTQDTSYFDFDKLKNRYLDEDMRKVKNFINNFLYNILIFFMNVYNILNSICSSIKDFIVNDSYNNLIYKVEYVDHVHYYRELIYNLSIFERFLLLFNNNKLEYSINNNTKQTIKELITSQLYGYIKISYYDNEKDNKILINLELFKHTNFLFKHTDLLICNVIQNFIKNIVVYDDKNILFAEIKYKDKTKDITDDFKIIKNSLKNNNVRLQDLLFLLNTDICNSDNYEDIDQNELSLIVTDGELEETQFKIGNYINYRTLYEDIAENVKN